MNSASHAGSEIPIEVFSRARREREFFNRYTQADEIPNELLLVPPNFDLPAEISRLVPQLKGKTVCDYGCGYGISSAYFALQGAITFAFDVSETNILIAQRAARVNGVAEHVFLQVMQAECLGFPDNFFDLVVGNGVLHHVDHSLAARELYRVLKPGATGIFLEPLGENRLLEWARRCRFRFPNHHHTEDERALRYSDIEALRCVFDRVTFRETGLLTITKSILRKVEVAMIAVPRCERALRYLARLDSWCLQRLPILRPLAPYIVISMVKSPSQSIGQSSQRNNFAELRVGSFLRCSLAQPRMGSSGSLQPRRGRRTGSAN